MGRLISRLPLPYRLAIAGALSIGAAVGIGRFVYTPILPPMVADLHLTQSQSGWIATANFIGYLLGALAATAKGFARAPRRWLTIGLVFSTLTTGAMGMVAALPLFLVLRALGGVSSAFVLVFASTLVLQRLAREGREDLSALHFAGVGCAIVVSALGVMGLEAMGLGWRAIWWTSGALSLLALAATLALLPPDNRSGAAAAAPSLNANPVKNSIGSLMLAYGLFGFGYVVTATFIVAIVKTYPAARPAAAFVWLLVGLAAIPSVWLWTLVGTRIGVRRAFAVACVAEAFGVAVSVLRPTVDGAVIASLLLGGTYMGITALGLVAAREAQPQNASKVLGRMTAAFGLGQMIGPAFAGWLAERMGGFGPASLIASAALIAAAALTVRPLR